ncbi:Regulator of nonsense transcripts 1 [Oopsacas minuta]|uniref:Regulator of nonsense transcripts 1 n=1 Tax=Oopsacas minuta TaxID=111878 RepID=A0AAV7KD58_9METZ|nr:Regulator of nonsense transcripts 1 [Oopsacas minuta]
MSRIFLCGSRSVGKTTLCKDWCEWNKEYVHINGNDVTSEVMDANNISRDDIINSLNTEAKELYYNLQKYLFIEQNKREELLSDRLFISDSGPDPLIYTHKESKDMSYKLYKHEDVTNCFNLYRKSLIVVVAPLEDDREHNSYTKVLRHVLQECGVPYMYLRERVRSKRLEILKIAAINGCVLMPLDQLKEQQCLAYYMDIGTVKNRIFCSPMSLQDNTAYIRKFIIYPYEIQLSIQSMDSTNRMLERYGIGNFVLLEFHWKVSDNDIKDILGIGLYVDGDEYQFIGCSSEELRSRTCYLMKGDTNYIDAVLSECGDFSGVNTVAERLNRIGYLFSKGINTGVAISNDEFEVIEDVSNAGRIFTDGCGLIGLNLAKKLAIGSNVGINSPDDNIPGVFQIRFQGYQCVVMKAPKENQDSFQLRNSMLKYNTGTKPFPHIWICNHSRPNSYGNLNKQFIMLLSGRGISDKVFLTKQDSYFTALENMLIDPKFAIKLLNWKNYTELAETVAACPSTEDMQQNKEIQNKLKYLKNTLVERIDELEIPVINSRYMFGVCDPNQLLEYGECFVRYTLNDELKTLQAGTSVIVGKNPCYHLEDIRVLITVDYPELNHLVDCIVFPVKGERPHTSEIAGSSLGEDRYFVCWDDNLIPKDVPKPYKYLEIEPDRAQNISRENIIEFFAGCMNNMDMINSYYQYWADKLGAGCRACRDLAQLLSRGVASTTTVDKLPCDPKPHRNKNLTSHGEMVWHKMKIIARSKRKTFTLDTIEDALVNTCYVSSIPEDFMIRILKDKDRSIPEYKILITLYKWCRRLKLTDIEIIDKFIELSSFINFGILTLNERIEAINHGIPTTHVMNALYKSRILTTKMLQSLKLPCYGWEYCFREKSSDFAWSDLSTAITSFTESFIILQLEEYILAFHIIGTIRLGDSVLPPGSLTSYLFSGGQMFRYVTECHYNINLATEVIQFYIEHKENTFLFMKRFGRSSKNDFEGVKYDIISIELDKFKTESSGNSKHPLIRKKNFQMIEVFVKNKFQQEISCSLDANSHPTENELEDLLSEDKDCFIELQTLPDSPLLAMKEFACKGDGIGFSGVLQHINVSSINSVILIEQFLILLSNVIAKIAHKCSSELHTQALEVYCNPGDQTIEQECSELPTPSSIFEIASTVDNQVIHTIGDSYHDTNPFVHEVEQYTHDKKYSSRNSVRLTVPLIEENGSDLDAQPMEAKKLSTESLIQETGPEEQVSSLDKFSESLLEPVAETQTIRNGTQSSGLVVKEVRSEILIEISDTEKALATPFAKGDQSETQTTCNDIQSSNTVIQENKPALLIELSDTEITPDNTFVQSDQPKIQSICSGGQPSEPVLKNPPKILIELSDTKITAEDLYIQAAQSETRAICNDIHIQSSEHVLQENIPDLLIELSETEITPDNTLVQSDQPEIQSICCEEQPSEPVLENKQEIHMKFSDTKITADNSYIQADQSETKPICSDIHIQSSEHVIQENTPLLLIDTSVSEITQDNPIINADELEIQETIQSMAVIDDQLVKATELRDTFKSLEEILNSPHIEITQARDILLLYSSLSKLHLYDVIKQHLCKSIDTIEIPTIAQYLDCISNWELWTFLPLSVSSQLSNQLFKLSLNLDTIHTPDPEHFDEKAPSIQDLCMKSGVPSFDQNILNYYRCYFSHLILNSLLNESIVEEMIENSDTTLCMWRMVYCQEEERLDDDATANPCEIKKKCKACFSPTSKIMTDKFTLGSYVKISFVARSTSSNSSMPIALGYISTVSNILGRITVEILDPVPDCLKRAGRLEVGIWTLTLLDNITTFKNCTKALHSLHESKIISILIHPKGFPPLLEIAQEHNLDYTSKQSLPPEEIENVSHPYDVFPNCQGCNNRISFNERQENAIISALGDSLTLIQGLPGTGKTVVAAEIVHQLRHLIRLKDRCDTAKMLVTGVTNITVDNLTYKLLDLGMLVLRIGETTKDLREYSLEYQLQMKGIELQENGEFKEEEIINKILKSADIIATTCSRTGDNILKNITFPYILIDDATQVIEPISLIPIVKSCERLILIGDPQQLVPKLPYEPEGVIPLNALRVTLFHRLHAQMEPLSLVEQYRMHPAIAEFPSRLFYSGRLRTAVSCLNRTPPNVRFLTKDRPVTFCNVESREEEAGSSWKNTGEANKVVEIIKELIATTEYKVSDIGVITLYVGQVKCIKDTLGRIQVDVDTIDSYRGREKEVIVFSTVRNTKHGDISLIEDLNTINVLLTRGRRAIIGVGNPMTLSRSHIWNEWYYFYFEGDNEDDKPPHDDVTEASDWAWDA